MHRRSRQVTSDELALWRHVTRDAQRLHGSAQAEPAAPPEKASDEAKVDGTPMTASVRTAPASPPVPTPAPPRPPASRRLDPSGPVDLDRRSWLRLRRGLYPIDARLDLHGLTQAEAYDRLTAFLATAQARGNRCVLVITGRGLRKGGTLRAMTPRWLDEPPNRPRVLAFAQAGLSHGGEGAIYVLLRRRSEASPVI